MNLFTFMQMFFCIYLDTRANGPLADGLSVQFFLSLTSWPSRRLAAVNADLGYFFQCGMQPALCGTLWPENPF